MKKSYLKPTLIGLLLSASSLSANMYFTAEYEKNKRGIFKSNGTENGTIRVENAMPEGTNYPDGMVAFKGKLYYSLTDSSFETKLYSYDGSSAQVIELYPDGNDQVGATYMGKTSTHIFFTGTNSTGRGIFAYDGENPPVRILDSNTNFTYNATKDNELYFGMKMPGATKTTFYKSDGTRDGTVAIKDYQDIGSTGRAGDKILFSTRPDTDTDHQLYVSDGTTAGTQLLKTINPTAGATVQYMVNDGNKAIFSANDGTTWELWESDGTAEGTKKFTNGVVNNIALFVYKDGTAYFGRNDGTNGSELWSFDKTNGAKMLSDFSYNGDSSQGIDISLDQFDNHFDNGKLYFGANVRTTIDDTPNFTDKELWVYDGNSTYLLKDIFPGTYEEEDYMMGGTYKVANKSNPSNFVAISFNDTPIITEGSSTTVTMSEDSKPTAFSLTLNATDTENDEITWSIDTNSTNGIASLSEISTGNSQAINYTPNENYNGTDSFVVSASDGNSASTITVNITIDAVNDIPIISSTPITTAVKDTFYSYELSGSEVDGEDLNWSVKSGTSLPSWLSLKGGGDVTDLDTWLMIPLGITVDTNGDVYFVDSFKGLQTYDWWAPVLKKYNADDGSVETLLDKDDGLLAPTAVVLDGSGNLYFADTGDHSIKKYNLSNSSVETIFSDDNSEIYGITLNSTMEYLYISDANNGSIKKCTLSNCNNTVETLIANDGGDNFISGPRGIAVDESGTVYFADLGDNAVKTWDSTNGLQTLINTGLNEPWDVKIDRQSLYITDSKNATLKKYNLQDKTISVHYDASEVGYVYGLAVDESGSSYVSIYTEGSMIRKIPAPFNISGNPTTAGIYDVNLTLSDETNDIDHSFQIIVPGELDINPSIEAGTIDTATKITYTPANGNSLKYMFSNSSVDTPNYGDSSPFASLSYSSGTDINNAEAGTYLVVYEVDSNGNIVGFYQKELNSTDIANSDSNTDEETTTPTTSNHTKVVETTLIELGFATIKNQNEQTNYVVSDLTLPTTFTTDFGNATISWASNDKSVVQTNGTVSKLTKDTEVTLTATIKSGDETRKKLIYITVPSDTLTDADIVKKAQNSLSFDMIKGTNTKMKATYSDLNLSITSLFGTDIVWSSNNTSVIDIDGSLTRQTEDTNVTITATISKGSDTNTTSYDLIVKKQINESKAKVLADAKALSPSDFLGDNRDTSSIVQNLNSLPIIGRNDSTISWKSSNTDVIKTDGTVIRGSENNTVTLTATLTNGSESKIVIYSLKVLAYATTDLISFEDTNTTIEETTTTTATIGGVTTSTSITKLKQDGKDINATVKIKGLTPQRSTLEDGTRKTAVEFETADNQKLTSATLYQNPNGTIENVIELTDENNVTKTAKISSLRPATNVDTNSSGAQLDSDLGDGSEVSAKANEDGSLEHKVVVGITQTKSTSQIADTTVVIQNDGAVETTSIVDSDTTVKVEAKTDGKANHSVVKNGKTSKANVEVAGATTNIDKNGKVETNLKITLTDTNSCGGSYYAEVVTNTKGENITKFKNNDESCYIAPTLATGESFPVGSESNITKDSDGEIHIQTTTPSLTTDTQFTIE